MFHNSWDVILQDEMQKKYFKYIKEFVKEERLSKTIYPPAKDLFNAFKLTEYKGSHFRTRPISWRKRSDGIIIFC